MRKHTFFLFVWPVWALLVGALLARVFTPRLLACSSQAVPKDITTKNFPCYEGGENCVVGKN